MKYLVDSDLTADYLSGFTRAINILDPLMADGLAISLVTYGEIYEGIFSGRDPNAAERTFRRWLTSIKVLPLSQPIMRRFARIRGDLRSQGQLIPDPDIMIAATALHLHLTLVTRNRKHFSRIPGLNLHP